jgi:hypothetical protein
MNDQIIADYKNGMSINACSKKYSLNKSDVRTLLSNANVHIRNRSEQNIFSNAARGYAINHTYFDNLDETRAYYLGFLAADGSVSEKRNSIKVTLSSVDKDFLEEFRTAIGSKRQVRVTETSNGFSIAEFGFSSQHIKQTLAKYSIVPNKTYKPMSMRNIPDELKSAFIKGYFDGDGSFSHTKGTTTGILKICAHRKELLQEFMEWHKAYYHGNFSSNIYSLKRKDGSVLYSWEMSTVPSIVLLDTFYNLQTPCLIRKRKKFEEFKAFRIENLDPRARTAFDHKVEKMC